MGLHFGPLWFDKPKGRLFVSGCFFSSIQARLHGLRTCSKPVFGQSCTLAVKGYYVFMKILGMTLAMFSSLFGVRVLSAQSTMSANAPGSFVEVDGSRLYYEECGTGPKAVILLHDGVVNSAVWDDVWPSLCKQFHVIRYDRRGHGHSPATKKPYYEADDVAAIIRDRKLSQAALVGSSHGGNVALRLHFDTQSKLAILCLLARRQTVSLTPNISRWRRWSFKKPRIL